jgi:uncharacterized membrane protein YidH (DUF202 family)
MTAEKPIEAEQTNALKKPTLLQVFGSVLSAIFGIQNSKNRERDFSKGDPKQFIVVYVFIVICVVLSMVTLVRIVLRFATAHTGP